MAKSKKPSSTPKKSSSAPKKSSSAPKKSFHKSIYNINNKNGNNNNNKNGNNNNNKNGNNNNNKNGNNNNNKNNNNNNNKNSNNNNNKNSNNNKNGNNKNENKIYKRKHNKFEFKVNSVKSIIYSVGIGFILQLFYNKKLMHIIVDNSSISDILSNEEVESNIVSALKTEDLLAPFKDTVDSLSTFLTDETITTLKTQLDEEIESLKDYETHLFEKSIFNIKVSLGTNHITVYVKNKIQLFDTVLYEDSDDGFELIYNLYNNEKNINKNKANDQLLKAHLQNMLDKAGNKIGDVKGNIADILKVSLTNIINTSLTSDNIKPINEFKNKIDEIIGNEIDNLFNSLNNVITPEMKVLFKSEIGLNNVITPEIKEFIRPELQITIVTGITTKATDAIDSIYSEINTLLTDTGIGDEKVLMTKSHTIIALIENLGNTIFNDDSSNNSKNDIINEIIETIIKDLKATLIAIITSMLDSDIIDGLIEKLRKIMGTVIKDDDPFAISDTLIKNAIPATKLIRLIKIISTSVLGFFVLLKIFADPFLGKKIIYRVIKGLLNLALILVFITISSIFILLSSKKTLANIGRIIGGTNSTDNTSTDAEINIQTYMTENGHNFIKLATGPILFIIGTVIYMLFNLYITGFLLLFYGICLIISSMKTKDSEYSDIFKNLSTYGIVTIIAGILFIISNYMLNKR
jgi:hypothetical protein